MLAAANRSLLMACTSGSRHVEGPPPRGSHAGARLRGWEHSRVRCRPTYLESSPEQVRDGGVRLTQSKK